MFTCFKECEQKKDQGQIEIYLTPKSVIVYWINFGLSLVNPKCTPAHTSHLTVHIFNPQSLRKTTLNPNSHAVKGI